ncbi:MFS transporter [Roseobacter sp. YSTF-M11]|uniref:MFS transporter n=1 Tax=Roseobacter insulae TaxID=2859783 RepID=A0A9X1K3T0_9RHOB|nr:MFS transporter [Roseobacter insulae]MBW4708972.1 MFS transporter [Roseobacter insulae]
MFRNLLPISALLLSSALLLFAGGTNGLILPVRGTAEGFDAFSLGLLGTGWAVGYVAGCLLMPMLVSRVGHIRSFTVMAALAAVAILASLIFLTPTAWVPLRALSGLCFAGAAMIVESWLSERSDASNRGRIFGTYTMVNLVASTAGQMSLTLAPTDGHLFFVLGAIFYALALVPVAITSSASPKPLVKVRLDLRGLWGNSPVAVVAIFLVGVSNSAFGTLAAVYAGQIGLSLNSVALFASIPILAGAVAQMPVGYLSDRMDRRKVLVGIAALALVADLAFIVVSPQGTPANLVLVALFGASIFSMYPVIVAHANDHAEEGSFIQTSGGLLLVFGLGSIIGPLVAGLGMSSVGVSGLFITTVGAHVLMIAYALLRITMRAPVALEDKGAFVVAPPGRATTPETAAFASGPDVDTDSQAVGSVAGQT